MIHLPISWEELIRGSARYCNRQRAIALVRAKMIGNNKKAGQDQQCADDDRECFGCVVCHCGEDCNENVRASSLR